MTDTPHNHPDPTLCTCGHKQAEHDYGSGKPSTWYCQEPDCSCPGFTPATLPTDAKYKHGPCCTCQNCGEYYDNCECDEPKKPSEESLLGTVSTQPKVDDSIITPKEINLCVNGCGRVRTQNNQPGRCDPCITESLGLIRPNYTPPKRIEPITRLKFDDENSLENTIIYIAAKLNEVINRLNGGGE